MKKDSSEKEPLVSSPSPSFYSNSSPPSYSEVVSSGSEVPSDLDNMSIPLNVKKPRKMRQKPAPTSDIATLMHLLKANIGTGILAMPSAFANSGLLVGSLGIPIVGLIALHCMHLLLTCQAKLCARFGETFLDYEQVAEKSFVAGPKFLKNKAKIAKGAVVTFLLITQLGFCCVYSLFVAENVREFIRGVTNNQTVLSVHALMLCELPFMIAFNFVRHLKHLALASTVANVLQCAGLAIVFYDLMHNIPDVSAVPLTADISRLPLYFGTAIYAFEGIGLVLPLQKDMREPSLFGATFGVLNTGMIIVGCLYLGMGFFGFLKYSATVKGSITLNLPPIPLYETVQLMFALAVFLSYALQLYVPICIIWPYVQEKFDLEPGTRRTRLVDYSLRATLVTITFVVSQSTLLTIETYAVILAGMIPRLDLFISLVGAFSSSCLALIFPPIIELATFWEDEMGTGRWSWLVVKNTLIFIIGVIGFLTGAYASVVQIVNAFGLETK